MFRPFTMNQFSATPLTLPRETSGTHAGHIGGFAPQNTTIGLRRDFSFTPMFLPRMTIQGGLKQPPRF